MTGAAQATESERSSILLSHGEVGKTYRVVDITLQQDSLKKRLETLGMTQDSCFTILHKKRNNAQVILLRETRWALGANLTACIKVIEVQQDAGGRS